MVGKHQRFPLFVAASNANFRVPVYAPISIGAYIRILYRTLRQIFR